MKSVVDTEAPLSVDLLTDRLCEACGIKRKTPPVKERMDYLIKLLKYSVTIQNITLNKAPDCDRQFIWKDSTSPWRIPETYRCDSDRDADQVPIEEAACAAIFLARTQFGMPRDALIRETGKVLGFKTSTPKVKDLCDSAITYAIELGELTEGDHMIK